MKKVVLQVGLHKEKTKQKAMKAVSSLPGVDSISIDMEAKKLTVIGVVDPVDIVLKLRKECHCCAVILTVGPAKEEKKDGGNQEEEKKKKEKEQDETANLLKSYLEQHPPNATHYVTCPTEQYFGCVIC